MSLTSLPNELLVKIFYDAAYTPKRSAIPRWKRPKFDPIEIQPCAAATCRRLHDVVIRVLYSHPQIHGYYIMQRFSLYLHSHPDCAAYIKTLAFALEGDSDAYGSDYYLWSTVRIPFLPNCLELYVLPWSGNPEVMMPFVEVLIWATYCPKLTSILLSETINGELDGGQRESRLKRTSTIEDLSVNLPQSLHILKLERLWMDIDHVEQLWALCHPWMTHLFISGGNYREGEDLALSDLEGIEDAALCVTSLLVRTMNTEVGTAIPQLFLRLEIIDVEFPFPLEEGIYMCLRTLHVHISWSEHIIQPVGSPFDPIKEWLTAGAVPILERLVLSPITEEPDLDVDWERDLPSRLQESLKQVKIVCRSRNIVLELRGGLLTSSLVFFINRQYSKSALRHLYNWCSGHCAFPVDPWPAIIYAVHIIFRRSAVI